METVEDEALVHTALTEGPEAFAPIVRRYQSAVFGVALARVLDFHDAEDIAQAVFVDAFLQLDRLQDTGRLGAWLRTMAINKSIDRLRRRRDSVDVEQIANDPRHAEMHMALQNSEVRDQVMDAISRIGPAHRETITLHYLTGYSVEEIARIQGAPVGTVKARLHHGRKSLKREMIEMVETTLTEEGPGEELTKRVLEVLSRHELHSHDVYRELRKLGAKGAMNGFANAAESSSPQARRLAAYYAASFAVDDDMPLALEIVKRGLRDPNRQVRFGTVLALKRLPCSRDVIRKEFVPLVIDLLFDQAKRVRQRAAWYLDDWAADVPLDRAAWALLKEPNRNVRKNKERLLQTVLEQHAGDGPEIRNDNVAEQLSRCQEDLTSRSARVRAGAIPDVLLLATRHPDRSREFVPLAVSKLKDPARRVRWRAAYELCAWAGEVPVQEVEEALVRETNTRARWGLERLLNRAKEQ